MTGHYPYPDEAPSGWHANDGTALQGREAERAALDDLLTAARRRRSGATVLTGDPGIGKSTLLRYAREQAGGMLVLSAHGYEAEATIPFAGLAELVRPVTHHLHALPPPQAAALNGALALGPPVVGDRFSVCAATISLLAAVAERDPVLVVIDDLHWLDASSREAVLFAARRLNAEGVALIMAARANSTVGAEYAGIAQLRLGALSSAEVNRLIDDTAAQIPPETRRRIYADVAGNPLGIEELCAEWLRRVDATGRTSAQSSTADPLPSVGPTPAAMPPDSRLTRAMAGRLSDLPEPTGRALVLAASAAGAGRDVVLVAARNGGLELADFAPAEAAGLLSIDDRQLEFRHPLLRSVVYGSASAHARADAHAALAQALAAVPGETAADARAWHLANARLPPDQDTAALLAAAAQRARLRGGYLEAARAYQQAARFARPQERAALQLRAARALQLAGRVGEVPAVLAEALADAPDPRLRARIRHMIAYTRIWQAAPDAVPRDAAAAANEIEVALSDLVAGSQEVEADDSDRAALMVADAAVACFMLGRLDQGMELVGRARRLAPQASVGTQLVLAVAGAAVLAAKGRRGEAEQQLNPWMDALLQADPFARAQELAHANFAWIWMEKYEQADRLVSRLVPWAREHSVIGMMPMALAAASELSFRRGQWIQARAQAEESVQLSTQIDQPNLYGHVYLARLDGLQGRPEECLRRSTELEAGVERLGAKILQVYLRHTLGLLALGRGELDTSIQHLEAAQALASVTGLTEKSVVPVVFDLIEAYARSGRTVDANRLLDAAAPDPSDHTQVWAHAAAARCRGLLARHPTATTQFELALEWHARSEQPFERARTLLCAGERLRRDRRRAAARDYLHPALETFEQLNAVDWTERTRAELVASGETVRRGVGPAATLTPQELQVALVVADGLSNQEAATALFLSPKTIEYHLSNVYRKLNLQSRTELADLRLR